MQNVIAPVKLWLALSVLLIAGCTQKPPSSFMVRPHLLAVKVVPYAACPGEPLKVSAQVRDLTEAMVSIWVDENTLYETRRITLAPEATEFSLDFTAPTLVGTYSVIFEALGEQTLTGLSVKDCP